ncbi:PEP-CTERM sorting domain-containing protein [Puniceicoccaceae bacterium K14]|nr:PEP-CTERM sorting domain-containing protein [Puniceicoccaceae bacterium K14]
MKLTKLIFNKTLPLTLCAFALASYAQAQSGGGGGQAFVTIENGETNTVTSQADVTDSNFVSIGVGNADFGFGDPTTVNFTGGTINTRNNGADTSLTVIETSVANISGTIFTQDIIAFDSAMINFTSGGSNDDVVADDNAIINFNGGFVGDDLETYGNATVNILAGTFGEDIEARGNSDIFISGGNFTEAALESLGNSMITLFGSDFKIDGTPVAFGELGSSTSGTNLMGTLASGETFDMPFNIGGNGSIVLTAVPEPSTYAAIIGATGLLFFFQKRRKRLRA